MCGNPECWRPLVFRATCGVTPWRRRAATKALLSQSPRRGQSNQRRFGQAAFPQPADPRKLRNLSIMTWCPPIPLAAIPRGPRWTIPLAHPPAGRVSHSVVFPPPPLGPADRFARILDGLCAAVAARGGGRDRLAGPLVILIWSRLRRLAAQIIALAARIEAGRHRRYPARRPPRPTARRRVHQGSKLRLGQQVAQLRGVSRRLVRYQRQQPATRWRQRADRGPPPRPAGPAAKLRLAAAAGTVRGGGIRLATAPPAGRARHGGADGGCRGAGGAFAGVGRNAHRDFVV